MSIQTTRHEEEEEEGGVISDSPDFFGEFRDRGRDQGTKLTSHDGWSVLEGEWTTTQAFIVLLAVLYVHTALLNGEKEL